MKERIVMFLALGLMGAATVAQANQWYEAKHCWDGGCEDSNCKLQDSPARMVEENDGIIGTGNRITDGSNGEVDVYIPYMMGSTFILFRTEKSCEAFIAKEVQKFKKEEDKERKADQELEKKYN